MNNFRTWLRDWWRGFSATDLDSALAKLRGPEARRPDGIIEVSMREVNALRDYNRRRTERIGRFFQQKAQ
jgi:hypothetical protein